MKVLAITGIRSEYDILYPVLKALHVNKNYELELVVSGAHLSQWHGKTYKQIENDGFKIVDRIDSLVSTDREVQRPLAVSNLLAGLARIVERQKPDILLVVGDREESIATAIVGNYMNVLVAHIGGGDPVWGNSDDPIRMATSKLSHLHFATTKQYCQNLEALGEDAWRIHMCGTPGLDNIRMEEELPLETVASFIGTDLQDYVVLINHPLSSEAKDILEETNILLGGLEKFCMRNNYKVVCIEPNSDPGSFEIVEAYNRHVSNNFKMVNTLPRSIFVNLMRNSRALIGNSSMGILEAPMYKLPVVNVGNRQRGRLNAGNVKFVPFERKAILSALEEAALDEGYRKEVASLVNPYGDGRAAEIILDVFSNIDAKSQKWLVKQQLVKKKVL